MPFGAHETMEVHEVLNEKLNVMEHFSLYITMVQQGTLKQMLERQLQDEVNSYNQLVNYTHNYSDAQNVSGASMPQTQQVAPAQIQYGLKQPLQQAPQSQGPLNDRQIVSAMLCFNKNMSKNQMGASLECADPNIRQMLVQGAMISGDKAYEVFLFMNQQGMYQVPTLADHTAKTFLHSYQSVPQAMIQDLSNPQMNQPQMNQPQMNQSQMNPQGNQGMQPASGLNQISSQQQRMPQ